MKAQIPRELDRLELLLSQSKALEAGLKAVANRSQTILGVVSPDLSPQ